MPRTSFRRLTKRHRAWWPHAVAVLGAVLIVIVNGGLDGAGNAGLSTMLVAPAVIGGLLALGIGVLQILLVHPSPRWAALIRVIVAVLVIAIAAAVGLGTTLGCELSGDRCGVTWPGGLGVLLAVETSLLLHWAAVRAMGALLDRM